MTYDFIILGAGANLALHLRDFKVLGLEKYYLEYVYYDAALNIKLLQLLIGKFLAKANYLLRTQHSKVIRIAQGIRLTNVDYLPFLSVLINYKKALSSFPMLHSTQLYNDILCLINCLSSKNFSFVLCLAKVLASPIKFGTGLPCCMSTRERFLHWTKFLR